MRLFIAEKPSVAKAIAKNLGGGQKEKHCYRCGEDVVTWCFGHMVEPAFPEAYSPDYVRWRKEDLPIVPEKWKYSVKKGAEAQLKAIAELLKQADYAVNAGDPDREGQLLIQEVFERSGYHGPRGRLWLRALDDRSVKEALNSITDDSAYASLSDAARARQRADWLVGINATRALTLTGREQGKTEVLSLGRVQTPTLALVVSRDTEIASFKPVSYFVLKASVAHKDGDFTATFIPGDTQPGLDSERRLIEQPVVQALMKKVKGENGTVLDASREVKSKTPPLPHCLSSLQKEASAALGMSAKQVLDMAQKLYEKKLTTYPRTDCRYLPAEQFDEALNILVELSSVEGLEKAAASADFSIKSAAWNTKKVTAHHGIIPTGVPPKDLGKGELALYQLIALNYVLQFHPNLKYESQKLVLAFGDTRWEAHGRSVLEAGWSAFKGKDFDDEDDQSIPSLTPPAEVKCRDIHILSKKTTPPSRYTEGTLIEAMSSVHRLVSDADAKATLKDHQGIGTEATRAGIIETLKARGYLKAEKKAIVSTPLGQEIIALTPPVLKDPVTTAEWEARLEAVAQGKTTLNDFLAEQIHALPQMLAPFLSEAPPAHACPNCGAPLHRHKGKDEGYYWACSAHPNCKTTLPDSHGTPGKPRPKGELTEFSCPDCGKPLVRRKGQYGEFFGCIGYPGCKQSFKMKSDGTPDFTEKEAKK